MTATTTTTPTRTAGRPSPVWLAIIALLVVVALTINYFSSSDETTSGKKQSIAPAPSAQASSRTSGGVKKTLYRFPQPKGCVDVEVRAGYVYFYPKGGEVEYTLPDGSKIRDKPGVTNPDQNFPTGHYTICGIDSSADGVDVWN